MKFYLKWGIVVFVMLFLMTVLFLRPKKARADEFSDSFATVDILSADCASMGNACVAAREFSSDLNPALIAITDERFNWGASPTYAMVSFKKGLDIQGGSVSFTTMLPQGVLQLTYTGAKSDRQTDRGEMDGIPYASSWDIDSLHDFGVQYGIGVGKNLYAGFGYNYSKSNTLSDLKVIIPTEGDPLAMKFYLDSKDQSHTFTAGAVYVPLEKVSLGIAYSYTRTKAINDTDIPAEIESIPDEEKTHMDDLRIGATWKLTDKLMLSGDYRHAEAEGNNFDQYYVGAEYCFHEAFCIYAGRPNSGWSTGLGLYLEGGGVNIAYQYDPYEQVRDDLGKAEVVVVSGYLNF